MSVRVTMTIDLHIMRLKISPIAIGQTPGDLSSAIKQLDISALISFQSTIVFDRRRASITTVSRNLTPLCNKKACQWVAVDPPGPALPSILFAAVAMCALVMSKSVKVGRCVLRRKACG